MNGEHTDFGPFGNEAAFVFHEIIKQTKNEGDIGRKTIEKGDQIFREGMYPVGLFCIIKGKVKVSRINDEGREHILRLFGENDILGYKSLIMDIPYHASGIALEDTQVGFVSKRAFDEIIDSNPKIARLFMRILCQNLDESEDFLVSMASKNIREKVAGAVLFLVEKYGLNEDDTLAVNLSREEIAGMIGIATENLSRAITQLKEENLIASKGRKIVVLNKEGLEKVRGDI